MANQLFASGPIELGLGDDVKCTIRSRLEFGLVNFNAVPKCYIAVTPRAHICSSIFICGRPLWLRVARPFYLKRLM
jgi:hypothetical protein